MSQLLVLLQDAQQLGISLYSVNNELKFQAPKGSMNSEIKSRILQQKTALIELLSALDICAPNQLDAFGLSYEQKRLWFADKLSPELAAFNMPDTLWINGALDQTAFCKAVDKVIERHWVLRTNVVEWQGEALARLQLTWQTPVAFHDLSMLPEAQQQSSLQDIEKQALLKLFDLSRDILMRWTLVKVADTKHKLFFDMHHIASDAGSMDLLFSEVLQAYEIFIDDPNASAEQLTPLTAQYRDYAQWQRLRAQSGALETDRRYWQTKLADIPVTHQLPLDYPRPPVWTGVGGQHDFTLCKASAERLFTLAAEQNVTPFMLLFSAYALMLAKHSRSADVIVGTPITGRAEQRFEPLIGFFVNNLVLRTQADNHLSYRDFLQQVRHDLFDAFAHQSMPFDLLVEQLNPERSTAHEAIFQINFYLYDRRGLAATPNSRLDIEEAGEHKVQLKNDLELAISLHDQHVHLELLYATDLFSSQRMQQFGEQLVALLERLPTLLDTPIAEIDVITAAQREFLLHTWHPVSEALISQKDRHQQPSQRFDQRFARIVAQYPEQVAVVDADTQLTYQQLAQRANQVSHRLLTEGVAVGDVVAIAMPRGIHWAVAVLAIAQIGGAYLPLDLKYPSDRLDYMLQDSGAKVVIGAAVSLPAEINHQAYQFVDLTAQDWAGAGVSAPDIDFDMQQALYLIYTSGSTGQPKGVVNTHLALSHYFDAVQAVYQVTPADNVMQFSSVSFDIFVEELSISLLSGASLVFRNDACLAGDQQLWDWVQQQQISIMSLPTSFFHVMAEQLRLHQFNVPDCLRLVIYGGEAVSVTLLAQWQQAVGGRVQSLNTYGPTEATVVATYLDTTFFDAQGAIAAQQSIPIGKPFDDTHAYILDDNLQLVPPGVWGELCLSGGSIAAGYLGKPEQTAEVFVADPFLDGFTLYRTGDVARIKADGNLEFGGRRDSQVKFRGYRIELEEITRKIEAIDSCSEAVVMIQKLPTTEQEILVAFVKPLDSHLLDDDSRWLHQVQQKAADVLPAYMLPSQFAAVVDFPMTTNGKIDKAALPNLAYPNAAAVARLFTQAQYQQVISPQLSADLIKSYRDIGQLSLRDIAQRLQQDSIHATTEPQAESASTASCSDSEFWRGYLSGLAVSWYLPSATVSIDHAPEIAVLHSSMPTAIAQQLPQLAQHLQVSSETILQSLFMWMLHRHSSNKDIAINTCLDDHSLTTLRTEINPEQTLQGFITQLAENRCQLHGKASPSALQLEQWLDGSIAGNSNEQTSDQQRFEHCLPCALTCASAQQPPQPQGWRLNAHCQYVVAQDQQPQFTAITWQYDQRLWSSDYIQRFKQEFVYGLQWLIEQQSSLDSLALWQWDILPAAEKAQLTAFNEQSMQASQPLSVGNVHQRILAQIQRTPDKLAVALGDERYSYAEIGQYSEQLAAELQQAGIKLGDRVGVCLDRGGRFIISILAIMRSGACYVPIDTSYPAERQRFIQEDSSLQAIISDDFSVETLPSDLAIPVIQLHSQGNLFDTDNSSVFTEVEVPASAELYVIYTSGSTGTPKGAAITHANELNLLDWYCPFYKITDADRVLVASNVGFDLTQKNLLAAMVTGASLFFATAKDYDPDAILDTIQKEQLHWTNFSPSLLYPLVKNPQTWHKLTSLRWVMLGGEPINMSRLNAWLATCPPEFELINQYGPTEATDVGACYTIPLPHQGGNPPIGRPNANVCLYVLDEQRQPVPLGAIGELYIGGFGVSKGYIGRPELNATCFLDNPWRPGEKMYKTGDVARYREDGVMDFLGRVDHQVNIRSLRIELGEIMTRLKQLPQVADVLVTVHNPDDEPNLLAYVVVAEDQQNLLQTPESTEQFIAQCRQHLAAELPNYMVPNLWQALAQFPLTPNGKIDRKKLPEPSAAKLSYQAPANALETQLQTIWCDILERPAHKVGVTDLLFALGGHSLTATRIAARINHQWSLSISSAELIADATIRALAKLISRKLAEANDQGSAAVVSQQIPQTQALQGPLSFSQQRLWFVEKLRGGTGEYVMLAGFKVSGDFEPLAAQQALQALIQRHQVLRSVYLEQGDQVIQQVLTEFNFSLQQHDLSTLSQAEQQARVEQFMAEQGSTGFDLRTDLMLRAHWLQLSANDGIAQGVLIIAQHHIASDGWSMGVLAQEFMLAYQQLVQGQAIQLPELPIQYLDFAIWQQQQAGQFDASLAYWKQALADIPSQHRLPLDTPRSADRSRQAARVFADIPASLLPKIQSVLQQHQLTPFMLMHSVYAWLLSRLSHSETVVIGTPVANRHWPELEPLIGFFVNTLALPLALRSEQSIAEYLQTVRSCNLAAQAHQQVPFEQLVEALGIARDSAYSPIFQCLLAMDSTPRAAEDDANAALQFDALAANNDIAKFDVTLSIGWTEDSANLCWEYDASLFHESRIQQFNAAFLAGLQQLVTLDSQQPISRLSLFSEAQHLWFSEQQQIVADQQQETIQVDEPQLIQAVKAHTGTQQVLLVLQRHPAGELYLGLLQTPRELVGLADDSAEIIAAKQQLKTALANRYTCEQLPHDWLFIDTVPASIEALPLLRRYQAADTQSQNSHEQQLQALVQSLFAVNVESLPLDQPLASLRLQQPQDQQPLSGATQQQIAAFFAELTGIAEASLSPQSQFFAVGGHSLLVVQLLNRITQTFNIAMPLVRVFDDPSIAAIAAFVDLAKAQQAAQQSTQETEDDSLEEMEW